MDKGRSDLLRRAKSQGYRAGGRPEPDEPREEQEIVTTFVPMGEVPRAAPRPTKRERMRRRRFDETRRAWVKTHTMRVVEGWAYAGRGTYFRSYRYVSGAVVQQTMHDGSWREGYDR